MSSQNPSLTSPFAGEDPYAPRYISALVPGKLLLGGDRYLERDIAWYEKLLKGVKCRKKGNDNDRGRLLCQGLTRAEFFEQELATKNITGFSRDGSKKHINIPKLDENVLNAIFMQARCQFPGFADNYTDHKCDTVKALQGVCKVARSKARSRVEPGATSNEPPADHVDMASLTSTRPMPSEHAEEINSNPDIHRVEEYVDVEQPRPPGVDSFSFFDRMQRSLIERLRFLRLRYRFR